MMRCCSAGGTRAKHPHPILPPREVAGSMDRELRDELAKLKLSQLKKRAAADGVPVDAIGGADDSEDPFSHLTELIVGAAADAIAAAVVAPMAAAASKAVTDPKKAACAELSLLKNSQLRKKAIAVGVDEEKMEEAEDAANPRAALIELISSSTSDTAAAVSTVEHTKSRSHFGSKTRANDARATGPMVPSAAQNTKWVMLSYQWDIQTEVIAVRKQLAAKNMYRTWMDVDGGSVFCKSSRHLCHFCHLCHLYRSVWHC